MDKIEYEEWMLKGVHEGRGVSVLTDEERKGGVKQQKIEVSYTPSGHQQPGSAVRLALSILAQLCLLFQVALAGFLFPK